MVRLCYIFKNDWKLNAKLTLNLGVRYDYYAPFKENSGKPGDISAELQLTGNWNRLWNGDLSQKDREYDSSRQRVSGILAKDHIGIQYVGNERLTSAQLTNFAPRIGVAYQLDPQTVIRVGYGIFYGGLESNGGTNLGDNFPFRGQININPKSCSLGNCPSNGITLESVCLLI